MAKVSAPELKRYLSKQVAINIQGGRRIRGTLSGYDIFLNLVVDDATEMVHPTSAAGGGGGANGRVQERRDVWKDGGRIGLVVSSSAFPDVRGKSRLCPSTHSFQDLRLTLFLCLYFHRWSEGTASHR